MPLCPASPVPATTEIFPQRPGLHAQVDWLALEPSLALSPDQRLLLAVLATAWADAHATPARDVRYGVTAQEVAAAQAWLQGRPLPAIAPGTPHPVAAGPGLTAALCCDALAQATGDASYTVERLQARLAQAGLPPAAPSVAPDPPRARPRHPAPPGPPVVCACGCDQAFQPSRIQRYRQRQAPTRPLYLSRAHATRGRPGRGRRRLWSRATILAALAAYYAVHGRWPQAAEFRRGRQATPPLPAEGTLYRYWPRLTEVYHAATLWVQGAALPQQKES
jgi:hypothetical protein